MRFIGVFFVFVIIFALVGSTQALLTGWRAKPVVNAPGHSDTNNDAVEDQQRYRLRLTTTFDAERDPFALRSKDGAPPTRLLVREGDRIIYARTEDLHRGEPVILDGAEFQGEQTEIFVMATPSETEMQRVCGVRVEVFRENGMLCDDRTLWAEAGAVLSRASVFSLLPIVGRPAGLPKKEHGHE